MTLIATSFGKFVKEGASSEVPGPGTIISILHHRFTVVSSGCMTFGFTSSDSSWFSEVVHSLYCVSQRHSTIDGRALEDDCFVIPSCLAPGWSTRRWVTVWGVRLLPQGHHSCTGCANMFHWVCRAAHESCVQPSAPLGVPCTPAPCSSASNVDVDGDVHVKVEEENPEGLDSLGFPNGFACQHN